MERQAIEKAVDEWVREAAIDPATGAPYVDGGFEITDYATYLIGPMPDSDPPTSGVRTHLFQLRFSLTPAEDRSTVEPMVERLKVRALEDPTLGGRLTYGRRLEFGAADYSKVAPDNRRGGPVVWVQAALAEIELGPGAAAGPTPPA